MEVLNLKPETLIEISRLSQLSRNERNPYLTKTDTIAELMQAVDDSNTLALMRIIRELPRIEQRELTALVLMGRGDSFDNYRTAFNNSAGEHHPEVYLTDKPLFEYIPKGLAALQLERVVTHTDNPKYLSINVGTLNEILDYDEISREQRGNYDGGDIDFQTADLLEFLNDRQRLHLKVLLDGLTLAERRDLVSLYYLGNGLFSDFEQAYESSLDMVQSGAESSITNETMFEYLPLGIGIACMQGYRLGTIVNITEEEII